MSLTVTHTTPADSSFSVAGSTAWNATHTITGGEVVYSAAPNTDFDLTAGGGGGAVTFLSQSIVGVVVGDQLLVDVWFTIFNNSGSTRNYTPTITLGSFTIINSGASGGVSASASSRFTFKQTIMVSVSATNLSYGMLSGLGEGGTGGNAGVAIGLAGNTSSPQGWNTTTSDMTGTNTFSYALTSTSATTVQTLTLHAVNIRKISAT